MPTTTWTQLVFKAERQSLWGPNKALATLKIDSGDAMVAVLEASVDLGVDAFVGDFTGEAYGKIKFGLEAYAELPGLGSFDATLGINIGVRYPTGVDFLENSHDNGLMDFDFTRWSYGTTAIESSGPSTGAKAGLKFVYGMSVGVRNISYSTFGDRTYVPDWVLIDKEGDIPLIELSAGLSAQYTKDPFEGNAALEGLFEFSIQLPSGADVKPEPTRGTGKITGQGLSDDPFLGLTADLDKLVTTLMRLSTALAPLAEALEKSIFLEKEWELAGDAISVSVTILDVSATLGVYVSETVGLDATRTADRIPDVSIVLRSDNGTPDNYADDQVRTGMLGYHISMPEPNGRNTETGLREGVAKVTAYYDLSNVEFSHTIGIQFALKFTIEALKLEIGGDILDFLDLGFTVGPLIDETFPKSSDGIKPDGIMIGDQITIGPAVTYTMQAGGYTNARSGTDPSTWYHVAGAWGDKASDDDGEAIQVTYEVFYTDSSPPNWNPDAQNARDQVAKFREALTKNVTATVSQFQQLWGTGQTVLTHPDFFGTVVVPAGTTRTSWVWQANSATSIRFNGTRDVEDFNHVVISPVVSADVPVSQLRVNLRQADGQLALTDYLGFGSSDFQKQIMLESLGTTSLNRPQSILYQYGSGTASRVFESQRTVDVSGRDQGDMLVYLPDFGPQSHLFDGGGQGPGQYDVFIANLRHTDPLAPVTWDLYAATVTTPGLMVDIFDQAHSANARRSLNVGNVESMWLVTGDGDDNIQTYFNGDWVDTSGGRDWIRNAGDFSHDHIDAGDGDDIISLAVSSVPTPLAADLIDDIYGGRGIDQAYHFNQTPQGLRLDVFSGGARFSTTGADGLGADAGMKKLVELVQAYDSLVLDPATFAARGQRDGGATALMFINQSVKQGMTRYAQDVEHISIIGSDLANDLALYSGGAIYAGGDGAASTADALVADFHLLGPLLGIDRGLTFQVSDGGAMFGETAFTGFERLVVMATAQDDVLAGGALQDVLAGEEGNDSLYGGKDTVRDVLLGGTGDDRFTWSNDGADVIMGDARFYVPANAVLIGDATAVDILQINADGAETHGLILDFEALPGIDGALNGLSGADIGVAALGDFVTYADSLSRLLTVMDMTRNADSGVGNGGVPYGRGVSFTGANLNSEFMVYSGVEQVNITGSTPYSDLIVYQGGANYRGGEAPSLADQDVFVADFSATTIGIDYTVRDVDAAGRLVADTGGQMLTNGVFVSGMDRVVMRTGTGDDQLRGGRLADYFDAGGGVDRLWGGGGNDELHGGAGDDLVYWLGDGNDTAYGGAGFDKLFIIPGAGGAGVSYDGLGDTVTASSSLADMVEFDRGAAPGVSLTGWKNFSGIQWIQHQEFESVNVTGQDGVDDFIAFQGGVAYYGGERPGDADVFAGNFQGESIDLVFGTSLLGADGNDAFYDIGTGTYIGGFERFVLLLGSGNDLVYGGSLTDYIEGGPGADRLSTGDGGNDQLMGEEGDDILSYSSGYAYLGGGPGVDAATVDGLADAVTVTFFDVNLNTLTSSPVGAAQAQTRAQLKNIFDNVLPRVAAYNVADPGRGAFIDGIEELHITSGAANDFLVGASFGGYLLSDGGNDVLMSWTGSDVLIGGSGSDLYAFAPNMGNDLIAGETSAGATLQFIDHTRAQISFAASGNDLVITGIGGKVTVAGYFAAGGNGLNFSFVTSDFNGTLNLSGLGAPGGGNTAVGAIHSGSSGDDELISFSNGADTVFGLSGNDVFAGGPGADVMDGGADDDIVSYHNTSTNITVDLTASRGFGGDAEGDVLLNMEHILGGTGSNTLTGNRFVNNLFGGPLGDVLSGMGGDDRLFGDAGADTLLGGDGDDRLFGGAGNDSLSGGSQADSASGGLGNDTLRGGAGDDMLGGEEGNDQIFGDEGDDVLLYGGHEDTLTSGTYEDGVDTLDGGSGNDSALFGQFEAAIALNLGAVTVFVQTRDGPDLAPATGTLRTIASLTSVENAFGTAYADLLIGGAGPNLLNGGEGNDLLAGGAGSDTLIGGNGYDFADYRMNTGTTQGVTVDISYAGATQVFDVGGSTDVVSSVEGYYGTSGPDVFFLDAVDNTVWSGDGADGIWGFEGDDELHGETGADTLFGGGGADLLYGDEGADSVLGELGADVLQGGAGDDVLDGGEGDDGLSGDAGDDTLWGAAGNDYADYRSATAGVSVRVAAVGQGSASGGAGNDTLWNIENAVGSNFDDDLTGDGANASWKGGNMLSGAGGNDLLAGLDGDDMLEGGLGDDLLDGGSGSDYAVYAGATGAVAVDLVAGVATGADGIDYLISIENASGSEFADGVTGSAAANRLAGLGGADTLRGGAGRDSLSGGAGDDLLDGGAGNDVAIYEGYSSDYVITPSAAGIFISGAKDGTDLLQGVEIARFYDKDVALYNSAVTDTTAPVVESLDPQAGGQGVWVSPLLVISFDEVIRLGSGSIRMTTTADSYTYVFDLDDPRNSRGAVTVSGSELIYDPLKYQGSSGSSGELRYGTTYTVTISAGFVKDYVGNVLAAPVTYTFTTVGLDVRSDSNNNQLYGTSVNDTLDGESRNDVLNGLDGDDLLIGGWDNDTLNGGSGTDTASYARAQGFVQVDLAAGTASGSDGRDSFSSVENVIGSGYADGPLGGDTLNGDSGPNLLAGLAGADTLTGGGGDDSLDGGADDDRLDGGTGTDTAVYSGPRANYTVTATASGYTVTSRTQGTDTLVNMERIQFLDQSLGLALATDNTLPMITAYAPPDESTGVSLGANLVVTFSEAIARGTGSIVLRKLTGEVVQSFDAATSAELSISGARLTLNPALDFSAGSPYRLDFGAGSIVDLSGNRFPGDRSYSFTASSATAPFGLNLSALQSYTEDTPLDLSDVVVGDADSARVAVSLTLSDPAAGALSTATSGEASATYTAANGTWTASGPIADVNRLLAGITFHPAPDINSSISVTTRISDGVSAPALGVMQLIGLPVNDAPTATHLSGTASYLPDTLLDLPDIVVSDVDSANVTVTLTLSEAAAGRLTVGSYGAVASTWNATTGVWQASGPLGNVNVMLAGVGFIPASGLGGSVTIAIRVTDGLAPALTGSLVVSSVGTPAAAGDTYTVNANAVLTTAQPVAFYRFDDAGNLGLDSSGRTSNLMVPDSGLGYTASGRFGGGLSLGGGASLSTVDGRVPAGVPLGSHAYTVSAWFNQAGMPGASDGIIGWGNYFGVNQVNELRLGADAGAGGGIVHYWWSNDLSASAPQVYDRQFHNVAVTYDGTTRAIYLDGTLLKSDSPGAANVGNANFTIGKTFGTEFFTGILDNVAVFDRALTASQVDAFSRTPELGVLANDSDSDTPVLSAALVGGPAHGALSLQPDGSFSYTPAPGYSGPDSFTYRASDGAKFSLPATVNITVVAADQTAPTVTITDTAPGTATGPVTYLLAFSETVIGLAANDITVSNGSVTALSGSGSTYSVVVTPAADVEGSMVLALAAAAVTDAAGNASALTSAALQPIDTQAPTASGFTPVDEAGNVAVGSNVLISFSETIARGTGNIVLKTVAGATIETFAVTDSARLSLSGGTLTIDPTADLLAGTSYRVELGAGVIKDLAGNAYAGTSRYNFTTALASIEGEVFNGTPDADVLAGRGGNDTVNGLASDDLLSGGGGNDVIDGGTGSDTAAFSGSRAGYNVARITGGISVADGQAGRDGTDLGRNVEFLRFSDRSIDLGAGARAATIPAATLKTLEELYVGFFNRIPEASGLGYWIGQVNAGVSLASIANQFYEAGVVFGNYPSSMTNAQFIREIYKNVLGRPPGALPTDAEVGYWQDLLVRGTYTKGTMVLQMLSDVHTYFEGITDPTNPNYAFQFVSAHLNNKAAVANWYAVQQGLSLNVQAENVAFGIQMAALITPTDTAAAIGLVGLTDAFSTV